MQAEDKLSSIGRERRKQHQSGTEWKEQLFSYTGPTTIIITLAKSRRRMTPRPFPTLSSAKTISLKTFR